MNPTPKELVIKTVQYARYFKRRADRHPDPVEKARLMAHVTHNLQLARVLKACATKTGSYA